MENVASSVLSDFFLPRIWGHTFDDDNRLILLHDAADKDPELPEVLQNLPTIGLLYGPDPEKSEHEGSSDSQP